MNDCLKQMFHSRKGVVHLALECAERSCARAARSIRATRRAHRACRVPRQPLSDAPCGVRADQAELRASREVSTLVHALLDHEEMPKRHLVLGLLGLAAALLVHQGRAQAPPTETRSEEHTSALQSLA